ncbi:hypothetical protein SFRURICE_004214 [Spodoptera frugiperda]|nr:hypothetical protein SFRURICE_004214 [Spodoptera frugiperda]
MNSAEGTNLVATYCILLLLLVSLWLILLRYIATMPINAETVNLAATYMILVILLFFLWLLYSTATGARLAPATPQFLGAVCPVKVSRSHHAQPRDHQPHRHLPHPGAAPRQSLAAVLGDVLRCSLPTHYLHKLSTNNLNLRPIQDGGQHTL